LTTLINSKESSQISAADRGLLYGHSVFETIAVVSNHARLLAPHMQRMEAGCKALNIPFDRDHMLADINQLEQKQSRAVIRAAVSMGQGGRGYLSPENPCANRIVTLHDYPSHPSHYWRQGIEIGLVDLRLAEQPALAGIKHGNRLEQILARAQWQASWQEGLVRDYSGNVVEGTQSNVFIVKDQKLITPGLRNCGVSGVMRETVISTAKELGIGVQIMSLSPADIQNADEVFMTNSVIGLWPVRQFASMSYSTLDISYKILNKLIKNEVIPNYKA